MNDNSRMIEDHRAQLRLEQSNAFRAEKRRSTASTMRFEAVCFLLVLATAIATVWSVRASQNRMYQFETENGPAVTEPERIITPNIAPVNPSQTAGALFVMDASTYADKYEGRPTASGITYRHSKPIAASNRHRLGTRVSITYRGRTVYAVIEDRLAKRHSNRIDLSRSLWNALTNNAAPSIARGCKVMEVAR